MLRPDELRWRITGSRVSNVFIMLTKKWEDIKHIYISTRTIMCQWAGTRQQQFCQCRLDRLPEVVWSVSRPAVVAERLLWPTPRQRCTSWWRFERERWTPTPAGATDRQNSCSRCWTQADMEDERCVYLSQSLLYYRRVCKQKFSHLDMSLNATSDFLPL